MFVSKCLSRSAKDLTASGLFGSRLSYPSKIPFEVCPNEFK
jgi:hypothetical protein